MKKSAKKLTLNRETVLQLSHGEVSRAAGAIAADRTDEPFCVSNAVTCGDNACYLNNADA
jgi:hypothetical protein